MTFVVVTHLMSDVLVCILGSQNKMCLVSMSVKKAETALYFPFVEYIFADTPLVYIFVST